MSDSGNTMTQHAGVDNDGRPTSLGGLLASRRRERFVGRTGERELFRSALDRWPSPFSVFYVHGPGGIGKSSFLRMLALDAQAAGAAVVALDGQELDRTPATMLEHLARYADVPDGRGAITMPSDERLVLLIDTYEELASLDSWVRSELLPRLPATTLTVLAGRRPPEPSWRTDAAWQDLLRVVSLRNLRPEDCREYLQARNVDPGLHERLIGASHGHPLGLSLLVDVLERRGEVDVDPMTPDLVAALLAEFVDGVPDGEERRCLEACAVARATTESMLRDALEVGRPHELFRWLHTLSFVEASPDGLVPHELARDALDANLRWRDPAAYEDVFRRIRDHVCKRLDLASGGERQRAILDLKFLFKRVSGVASPVDWESWGRHRPVPAMPRDREEVIDLVAAAEGDEAAAIAAHWWDRQGDAFVVLRQQDELRGVLALLDLTAASGDDRNADPGAEAAWGHAQRVAPPRSGERVTLTRFVIDREAYQDPSPTMNAVPVITLERYLDMPDLAWDYLALARPDQWNEYFASADLPRAADADFEVAGRNFGLFCHDFRRTPVDGLITLWTERALARDPSIDPPRQTDAPLVLSQPAFGDAVLQAVKDLRRPDLLARNLLLRTRVVRDRAEGEPDVDTLELVLADAIDSLRDDPRHDKQLRAVQRTYVHGSPTQRAAAEVLGLPFSTYRRHLGRGLDHIVSWLWQREIHGPNGAAGRVEG